MDQKLLCLGLLVNPIIRFYRTPRLEIMWEERDWGGIEKECLAILKLFDKGLVRPWFEENGNNPPWLVDYWQLVDRTNRGSDDQRE